MAAWDQPGLAVAFVRSGRPPVLRGYGFRRRGRPERVDAGTMFAVGSCAKPFAAASLALLVEAGVLQWDDPVVAHVPWFRAADPAVTRALKVRDLVSNRSGLRSEAVRAAARSRRAYLEAVAVSRPARPYGARYGYDSDMFTLAGEVAAAISGRSWTDLATRRLFRPLGMGRTHIDHRRARRDPNAAMPHLAIEGRARPIPWLGEEDIAAPATGLNSTAADMAAWLRAQLEPGRSPLGARALEAMRIPQTSLAPGDSPFDGVEGVSDESYALGWFVMNYHGERVVYHHGSQDGFRAFTAVAPDGGLGFAALCNGSSAGLLRALFLTWLDEEAGRPPTDWSARMLARQAAILARAEAAETRRRAERGAAPPSRPLADFAGAYDDGGPIGLVEVSIGGPGLRLRMGRLAYDLRHGSGDAFDAYRVRPYPAPREAVVTFAPGGVRPSALHFDDHILDRRP